MIFFYRQTIIQNLTYGENIVSFLKYLVWCELSPICIIWQLWVKLVGMIYFDHFNDFWPFSGLISRICRTYIFIILLSRFFYIFLQSKIILFDAKNSLWLHNVNKTLKILKSVPTAGYNTGDWISSAPYTADQNFLSLEVLPVFSPLHCPFM